MSSLNLGNKENLTLLPILEEQVLFASHLCPMGEMQTLAKICGSSFWRQFKGIEHNHLGALMKILVAAKRVPFVFIRTNSSNHAVYERINTEGQ